jgi:hypothetical protein
MPLSPGEAQIVTRVAFARFNPADHRIACLPFIDLSHRWFAKAARNAAERGRHSGGHKNTGKEKATALASPASQVLNFGEKVGG